jgi:KDO2-lipid IV(A) lauroyltransferase
MAKPTNDVKSGPTKRAAWVYRAPAAPPLADLFRGGDRRKAAFRYHVTGNLKNLLDLSVHFGLKAVPASVCSAAGAWLGTFVVPRWHTSSVRKTQNNLKRLLPGATEEERDQVLKRSWENQGRIMTEFSIIGRLMRRAVWHDLHHFTDAYAKAR